MIKKVAKRKAPPITAKRLKDFYDLKNWGLSQSAMKTFMTCRRKWMLSIAGLEKKGMQINTHFGSIVHEMLDLVYQNLKDLPQEKVGPFVRKELERYLEENKDEIFITTQQNDTEKEMAIAITTAYFSFYAQDRKQFIESRPEYEFSITYNGVKLRGKIDGVFIKRNTKKYQMEHKTKSRWDEELGLLMLNFDFQNLMYTNAEETESRELVDGILYNIIRKPQLRQKKNESAKEFIERIVKDIALRPEWYFNRYEITYSPRDKAKFKEQLDGVLEEMELFIDGKLPDLQNTAQCQAPYRCEFLSICSSGCTAGYRIKDSIHPELDVNIAPDTRILLRYGITEVGGRKI